MTYRDLWLVAYLITAGCQLARVIPGAWASFELEPDERIPDLEAEYRNHQTSVDAKRYAENYRDLRSKMNAAKSR